MNHNIIKSDQFELHLFFRNGSKGKIIDVENSYILHHRDKTINIIKTRGYKKFDTRDYDFINSISKLYSNTIVFDYGGNLVNICPDVYESKYLKECHYSIFLHLIFREIEDTFIGDVHLHRYSKEKYKSFKLDLLKMFEIRFNLMKYKYSTEYLNSVFINFDRMSEEDQSIILSMEEAIEIFNNSYLRSMIREEVQKAIREKLQPMIMEEIKKMLINN